VTGHVDYELHDTLAGPIPKVTILATSVLATGLRQTNEPSGYELQHTPQAALEHPTSRQQ
jgi:hypothetical protein